MRYYTGVGSRNIPLDAKNLLQLKASTLSNFFHCRTGDAAGADQIFRLNASPVTSYSTKDVEFGDWTEKEILKHIPNDRQNFHTWRPYVKKLLMRNMKQVLGPLGNSPSLFLICWAPSLTYTDSSSGGTGYAIRAALAYNIPVFNLFDTKNLFNINKYIKNICIKTTSQLQ